MSELKKPVRPNVFTNPAQRVRELARLKELIADGYSFTAICEDLRASRDRIKRMMDEEGLQVQYVKRTKSEKELRDKENATRRLTRERERNIGRLTFQANANGFPRRGKCLGYECDRVFIQEWAGNRMCRYCRNG